MSVMQVCNTDRGRQITEEIYKSVEERLSGSTFSSCPVEFASGFLKMAAAQSCGKCTPCRIGLTQLGKQIDTVLDGYACAEDLDQIAELAESIYASSDCAIGHEAAAVVLRSIKGFADDFLYHIDHNDCCADSFSAVPCRKGCPAGVDVPGYVALVAEGRYDDAVSLVRKDNPFSVVCGLVCEHPCEVYCRRALMEAPLNIRGIKRFANDRASHSCLPVRAPATDKRVAIIGGGPAGLSAAYYLALMGHAPVVFEQHKKLGGMLLYGIPAYRLPREILQAEIDVLLSAGIEVKTGVRVGEDIPIHQIIDEFDATFVAIGAHAEKRLGIPGEGAQGVYSAVQILRKIADGDIPDFSDKTINVIGGGNVAMDVARTSLRLGAKEVRIVYRRRMLDMTAREAEIEMARAEGCKLLELLAPVALTTEQGWVNGLEVQPMIVGEIVDGRPAPKAADEPSYHLPCDRAIIAVGQAIDSTAFSEADFNVGRSAHLKTNPDGSIPGFSGVFSGGDCVAGPAAAIDAIAAGKAMARTIDTYLGFDHVITTTVEIPMALAKGKPYCARSNMVEEVPESLVGNFALTECGLKEQEGLQEALRCLRCDHFGLGALRGGRFHSW